MKTLVIKGADFSANALGKTIIDDSPINWKFGLSVNSAAGKQNVYNSLPSGQYTGGVVGAVVPTLYGKTINAVKLLFNNQAFSGYGDEADLNIPSKEIKFGVFVVKIGDKLPTLPLNTFRLSDIDISLGEKVIRIPNTEVSEDISLVIGYVDYDRSSGVGVIASLGNVTPLPIAMITANELYIGRLSTSNGVLIVSSDKQRSMLMDYSVVE